MSLVEMIARADEGALAASGLACVDRCLPLLGGRDDALRPVWAALDADADWSAPLAKLRAEVGISGDGQARTEAADRVRSLLVGVPDVRTEETLRTWSDGCSATALLVHRSLDLAGGDVPPEELRRGAEPVGVGPLVAGELRRQARILEVLMDHEGVGNGLRRTVGISAEGRRILRAAAARRARTAG
ncbi:hypothetical protein DY218_00475 [Streptomyces triticagri]|uniref:Uncharacterized protein n=1 Tax=Streptomyces triticagri TaxID=2293568 RepID=A0A372MCK6_9ACTN|nr:hypothetical protein [Streptomyces triticagri]RFU88664.1 hypothetical protein DY218_00475 [Streptomyces triticagri]